jgi:hypothetical protein
MFRRGLLLATFAIIPVARADVPTSGPQSATDAEDAYADAAQQLRSADAVVVRARQQAVATYRSAPAYAAAASAVDKAFDAFNEKRNALLMAADQHDPRFATWKKGAADVEAEISKAGQGPVNGVTPDQFADLLNQRASFLKQLSAAEDDAVNRDPDAKRLRQDWNAACDKLRALQDKQSAAVDQDGGVKSALATAATARSAVDRARAALAAPATADPAEPSADEFVRRYPRFGLGWNDAWLTYGSTTTPVAGK